MSSDFRVGDEVVCVNTKPHPKNSPLCISYLGRLTQGQSYVIREIRVSELRPDQVILGFDGIMSPNNNGMLYGYNAQRFRKVQKKFTGMSVLRSLLTPQPELVH